MRLVIVSDTHEKHSKLSIPDGDILIHCGDWTNQGNTNKMKDFLSWFSSQPHNHKIFIAGNHELGLDAGPMRPIKQKIVNDFLAQNISLHYLENSSIDIDGYKIYGSPISPFFNNWAFGAHRGEQISQYWRDIPNEINILLTHGMPFGIFDEVPSSYFDLPNEHIGCEALRDRIDQLSNLILFAGGHIHNQNGVANLDNRIFVNAAVVNERHEVIHDPIVIDI
jgi:hypothetical protein